MLKKHLLFISFFFCFQFPFLMGNEACWRSHFEKAIECCTQKNYLEADQEFEKTLKLISKEDLEKYPHILLARSENDTALGNYNRILEDTDQILQSKFLNQYERLECGIKRVLAYNKLGQEENAVIEYQKHIIDSPLMPKVEHFKDKIMITNVPNHSLLKKNLKDFMLSKYSKEDEDFHDLGNVLILDITKKLDSDLKNNIKTS
jgi:tetratricopeptide (TPR) repeat protein